MLEAFQTEIIEVNAVRIHLLYYKEYDVASYVRLLTEKENARLDSISHDGKRMEFCASRLLKHSLFGDKEIEYHHHGAPFIEGIGFISISHSKNSVGIAVCHDHPLGFDMEEIRDKGKLLAHKFISDHERSFLDPNDALMMTMLWSGKEAMYKLAGRKEIIFKEDLQFQTRSDITWRGLIKNPSEKISVEFVIFEHKGMVLSINPSAPTYEDLN